MQKKIPASVIAMNTAIIAGSFTSGAAAQQAPRKSTASPMLEQVVITARKKAESMQDVPVAVAAFGSDQIEALKVRELTNLTVGMPNVSLDDTGTVKGTADFMIRGLGINSSIPSIDPTVGIFVDGVYLGINYGVIMDTFDLAKIEVLRGPQGTLFGRNVTGDAILQDQKKPGEEFEFTARAAADGNPNSDGGLNCYFNPSVGGPVTDTLGAKLNAYYNDDEGRFENEFNGDEGGGIEQKMLRLSLAWKSLTERK